MHGDADTGNSCRTLQHRCLRQVLCLRQGCMHCRGRNAQLVNEEQPLDAVFKLFMTSYHHMLLATSADGTVTGLVTLEDVIEEMIQASSSDLHESHSRMDSSRW